MTHKHISLVVLPMLIISAELFYLPQEHSAKPRIIYKPLDSCRRMMPAMGSMLMQRPDSSIELWDSGVMIAKMGGDSAILYDSAHIRRCVIKIQRYQDSIKQAKTTNYL